MTPENRAPLLLSALILCAALFPAVLNEPPVSRGVGSAAAVFSEPGVEAHAYLVRILREERPLLKRREWKRLPPASLTKILTAVLARERLSSEDVVILSEASKKVEEKLSAIPAGESFLRDDALSIALVESANDAALALAERIGDRELFAALTKKAADELGLKNSLFKNPTGLDEEGHYSTAEDLAKLAEYVWSYHQPIWEISREKSPAVYSMGGREYLLENTNKLLDEFPAIIGGKTGFTDNARGTLLLLYPVRPDKVAVIVILKSEDRFEDGRKIIRWLEETFP